MTGIDTGHLRSVSVGVHRMFVDPADARAQAILAAGRPPHLEAAHMWGHVVSSRDFDVVIDVGANYGELLLSADLPPQAMVVAVEPNERVLPALRATLAVTNPTATILPSAVSDIDGEVLFHDDLTWWGNSTLCGDWKDDRPHQWIETTVPSIRLPTLLKQVGAGRGSSVAVKLDIEGAEGLVLRDSIQSLRRLRACALLVEIVRMGSDDLAWIVENFTVKVFDTTTGAVVDLNDVAVDHGVDPVAALALPLVYRRDVIAVI